MDALAHFHSFARYNAWANRQLYEACACLAPEELYAPRAAFFGSIHRTLNHILVGDRLWQARLDAAESAIKSLDELLYEDFTDLRQARTAEDAAIIARVDALDAHDLNREINYVSISMGPQHSRVHEILSHMFNHQTHHRGQVHACLSGTVVKPPSLDLIYFLRAG
ncbi:MAG: DinB family protein [Alphaproteobacteria bacterium]